MATQIVIDHTGDTRHQFDPADAAAVGGRGTFQGADGRRLHCGGTDGPGQSKVVGKFDPAAEETLFIPRLKGG
jgi:hypothetical protein